MKKLFLILTLVALAIGCGSIPRPVVLAASEKDQNFTLDGCGLNITIPAGWQVEKAISLTSELYVTKDKVDILVDVMLSESNAEKIWPKLEKEAEKRSAGYNMKLSKPMEKKKINGIDAVTFYGTAKGGSESIDVDAFNCPTGTSSVGFYVYSPVSTYKTDRAAVLKLVNSIKLADGYKFNPIKKK
jgi:hypothetical protein